MQTDLFNQKPDFDGSDYEPEKDKARLTNQIDKIKNLMMDGLPRTLDEIEAAIKEPQASISAQLRNLRKQRFGGHTVLRQRRDDPQKGLFEYQLIINKTPINNVN